jgi:hypothetical protein
VREARPSLGGRLLLLYALLGAPAAWVGLHVVGWGLSEAACNEWGRARLDIAVPTWEIALTASAGAIAAGAVAAAIVAWRSTRTDDESPPAGRIHFVATLALVLAPLFLMLVLLAGLGATVLPTCVQS